MSTIRTRTLSLQNLNQLYLQFFDRYVKPNLYKDIKQITQLLQKTSAYQTFNYLQQLFKIDLNETSNHVSPTHQFSFNSQTFSILNESNQFMLPVTNGQLPKSVTSQFVNSVEKQTSKPNGQNSALKSKSSLRKTLTGIPSQDIIKPLEFKAHKDDYDHVLMKRKSGDAAIQRSNQKDVPLSPMLRVPMLIGSIKRYNGEPQQPKVNPLKEIAQKMFKVFSTNHSKIEKYHKSSNQSQKIFNLNYSTKIQLKQVERVNLSEFQFSGRMDFNGRKK